MGSLGACGWNKYGLQFEQARKDMRFKQMQKGLRFERAKKGLHFEQARRGLRFERTSYLSGPEIRVGSGLVRRLAFGVPISKACLRSKCA